MTTNINNNNNNFAFISIKAKFNTNFGEVIKICGSIEELGNWIPERAKKLYTNKEIYPDWEMEGEIYGPKGMSFEYKFIYYNENTGEHRWETLTNNQNRSFYVESTGSYLLQNEEGIVLQTNSKKKKLPKSFSEIQFSQTKLQSFNNNNKEERTKFYSNLDYESNQFSGNDLNDSFNFYLNPKMSNEDRIVIVTPFLPFEVEKHGKEIFTLNFTDENLVYSIMFRMKEINICEVVWVGMLSNYLDFEEDDLYDIQTFLEDKNIHMVIPDLKSDFTNYWIYINNILKSVFVECTMNMYNSYFLDYDEYFNAYKVINKLFGAKTANITNPNDLIMINDIHLMLVPNYLLSKNINSKIGIYFHQAFPSSDVMKSFPYHSELIKSVLLCDVIGFHVFQFARNFLTACKRILGLFFEIKYKGFITLNYIGRNIIIRVMHAGIDIDYIKSIASLSLKKEEETKVNEKTEKNEKIKLKQNESVFSSNTQILFQVGQKTKNEFIQFLNKYQSFLKDKFSLVSIDTFEEPSSLLLKMEGYNRFLQKLSDMGEPIKDITFLQVIVKIKYKTLRTKYIQEVEESIKDIKAKYGEDALRVFFVDKISIPERLAIFKLGSVLYYLHVREGNCIYVPEFIAMKHIFREENTSLIVSTTLNVSNESVMSQTYKKNNKSKMSSDGLLPMQRLVNRNSSAKIKTDLVTSLINDFNNFQYGIIISENIGAPKTLKSPIRINPYNISSIVDALLCSYRMSSKEKLDRFILDIDFVLNNTTFNWIKNFFIDLKRTNDSDVQKIGVGMGLQFRIMKLKANFCQLNKKMFAESYHSSKLRVFFLDYEGTLQTADLKGGEETLLGYKPDQQLLKILERLSSDPNNLVFIVSGREKRKLDEWFGELENLNLASEHGYFMKNKQSYLKKLTPDSNSGNNVLNSQSKIENLTKESKGSYPNGNLKSTLNLPITMLSQPNMNNCVSDNTIFNIIKNNNSMNNPCAYAELIKINNNININNTTKWEELFKISDWSWKDSVLKILEGFTEKTEGSYIYKKDSIITWFYRDCDIYFGMIQANEINTHLHNIFEYCKLDIVNGKGYVEIKPKGVNKGFFVSHIIKSLYLKGQVPDFIFCIGDDTADEEMFKYLNSINSHLSYHNPELKIFSTTIGKKPSSANYFLNDTNEVLEYLEFLNRININEFNYVMSSGSGKIPKSKSKNWNKKDLSDFSKSTSNFFGQN